MAFLVCSYYVLDTAHIAVGNEAFPELDDQYLACVLWRVAGVVCTIVCLMAHFLRGQCTSTPLILEASKAVGLVGISTCNLGRIALMRNTN